MQIKRELVAVETIEQFADREGLVMLVRERRTQPNDPKRFYAHFEGVEVMGGGVLIGTYGDGETEAEAIINYTHAISLKRVCYAAFKPERREIAVPRLTP